MQVCLNALADQGLGEAISVGSGLGLLHYFDPLLHIEDAPARTQAEQVWSWFREAFLSVIDMD